MTSINYYKNHWLWVFAIALLLQYSCKKTDGYNTIVSTDKTKPGAISDVKITNFNGGAYITYTLPGSKNILYVQADYMINDSLSRQTKSSYYSDSITVAGFAQSKDYKVVLRVVSRANVPSDSVVVTVHPATPPYLLTYASLSAQRDFGGVNIRASNDVRAYVNVVTILPSASTGKYEIVDQNLSNIDSINYSLRGYDTLPKKFAFYVTDQYGNRSDTLYQTIDPIFEELMNKSLFSAYVLPSDVLNYQNGLFNLSNIWDGNLGEFCYNTEQPIHTLGGGKTFIWPAWATFDMGQTAKLSRYIVWDRVGDDNAFVWTSGAAQQWIMWGRADTPQDEIMPTDTTSLPPVGGKTPGGWINMGIFDAPPRPADNPLTSADIQTWLNGFNFNFSLDLPPVRYIRLECLQTMGGTNNYFNMNEISIYGNSNIH